MKKNIFALALLTAMAVCAFAQTRQIDGPLTLTVGQTATFRISEGAASWHVYASPSSSLQIVGSDFGSSVNVRVMSMPQDRRASIFAGGVTFHVDVVDAVSAVPAPIPGMQSVPMPRSPLAVPNLTRAEALQFAMGVTQDDLFPVMVTIALAAYVGDVTPTKQANMEALAQAMVEVHGEAAVLSAVQRTQRMDALARIVADLINR